MIEEHIKKAGVTIRERVLKDILTFGVGLVHEGMTDAETNLVLDLYKLGAVQVVVVTHAVVYALHIGAHLVIVQDTETWDPRKRRWTHYRPDLLVRFLGLADPTAGGEASNANATNACSALILCKSAKHEEIKRCIFEPLPVESNVDLRLADHLLSEIVTGTVTNKQEAVDWMTWTFAYRRLPKASLALQCSHLITILALQNPNYYSLRGVSAELISEYTSEIIETACETLAKGGCIKIDQDDIGLSATNLGLVAVFYGFRHTTVEGFAKLTGRNSQHKDLLIALTSGAEIQEQLPIRLSENELLKALFDDLEMRSLIGDDGGGLDFGNPALKAQILITAHLKRVALTPDLHQDLQDLLLMAERTCHALVDVMTSSGWLRPVFAAAELSQMITQGMLSRESSLLQLPGFSPELIAIAKKGVSAPHRIRLDGLYNDVGALPQGFEKTIS